MHQPAGRTGRTTASIAVLTCLVAGLIGLAAAPAPPFASSCGVTTAERIVAIGDVHGAYDNFVTIAKEAGLIDARLKWAGGKTIFVQTGDVLDRGADSRKVLDLLRRLETEASQAGGRVIPLLGNHEVMRMLGDLRYMVPGEYAAFATPGSVELRDRYFTAVVLKEATAQARAAGVTLNERAEKRAFENTTPLGKIEMQIAFATGGEYGRWLRTHDVIATINGVAFLHGGTAPAVAALGCDRINSTIHSEMKTARLDSPDLDKTLLGGPDGPLWYRGLVEEPPAVSSADLDAEFRALGVNAIVIGHTVAPAGTILPSFDGRVVQIDTGMLGNPYWANGAPSALEIKNGTWTAIYAGRREVLSKRTGGTLTPGDRLPARR